MRRGRAPLARHVATLVLDFYVVGRGLWAAPFGQSPRQSRAGRRTPLALARLLRGLQLPCSARGRRARGLFPASRLLACSFCLSPLLLPRPPTPRGRRALPAFLGTLYLGVLGTRATSGGSSALPALPYPTLCLRTGSACAAPSRGTSWCRSPVAGQGPGRPLCARTAPARARFACEGPPEPRSLAQAGQGPASSAEHVCRPNGIHALCFTHTSCPAVPAVRRK